MRIGILEIAIIIIVLIVIAVSVRILRAKPDSVKQSNKPSAELITRQASGRAPQLKSYLRRAGMGFILAGALLLFASIGVFRWAFQSYAWAFVLLAAGFAIVFLSRKK